MFGMISSGITIADLAIAAVGDDATPALCIQDSHQRFKTFRTPVDFVLHVHPPGLPAVSLGNKVFTPHSDATWAIYSYGDGYLVTFTSPLFGDIPYRLLKVDASFRLGELYARPTQLAQQAGTEEPGVLYPFEHPTDQLLVLFLLSRGRGVILHACGVVDEGKGILFCGVSGAGKSTIANIWKPTYATLLSDDRIIVRRMDGVFRMYGTPWHGDANVCDPGNAPLEKVFFIVHADRNYAKPISPIDAASRLLVRCFPPFWDKDGMEFVTNFLAEVAEEVPCYELGFVPDQSVVEFVRSIE
jgi:hypothetical protein